MTVESSESVDAILDTLQKQPELFFFIALRFTLPKRSGIDGLRPVWYR